MTHTICEMYTGISSGMFVHIKGTHIAEILQTSQLQTISCEILSNVSYILEVACLCA